MNGDGLLTGGNQQSALSSGTKIGTGACPKKYRAEMLGTLSAFSLSVFEPLLQGFGAFTRTASPQNAFRSQVFIQIRPMDIRTIAKNFAVLALLRRTVPKTGIQGHSDRPSVNDLQRQGIIADLYTLSAHFSHLLNTPRCGNTDTSRHCGSQLGELCRIGCPRSDSEFSKRLAGDLDCAVNLDISESPVRTGPRVCPRI